LQKVQTEVGESALSILRSPQPAPIELILTTLINEIRAYEEGFDLILDDYHIIDARPIHSAITFLLDYLPPHTRLIIAGRSDPPLPLSRLRDGGELTEIRVSDLRFTPDEAAVFLNEVMNLGLSPDDVASLETRTEGWIAGLQLAALSMQGRDDVAAFISAFAGDDRYVVDYLSKRFASVSPKGSGTSCCKRPFSTGSAAHCATLSPAGKIEPGRRRRLWGEATCLWFRWMPNVSGIVIITYSQMFSRRIRWRSSPIERPSCISGQVSGMRRTALRLMLSVMHWPPKISSGRRD